MQPKSDSLLSVGANEPKSAVTCCRLQASDAALGTEVVLVALASWLRPTAAKPRLVLPTLNTQPLIRYDCYFFERQFKNALARTDLTASGGNDVVSYYLLFMPTKH